MHRLILPSIVAGSMWVAAAASAQTTLGIFKDWTAYRSSEASEVMCMVVSQPVKSIYSQPVKARDQALFFIARVPAEELHNEPSMAIGYPFAEDAKAKIEIDGESKFTMFTAEDFAWVEDDEDNALVEAMRKGRQMVVEGRSRRGTVTKDTYSLLGVSAAVDAITKECP